MKTFLDHKTGRKFLKDLHLKGAQKEIAIIMLPEVNALRKWRVWYQSQEETCLKFIVSLKGMLRLALSLITLDPFLPGGGGVLFLVELVPITDILCPP